MLHLVLYSVILLLWSLFIRIFSFTGSICAVFGTWFLGIHLMACLRSRLSSSAFHDFSQWPLSGDFWACFRVLGVGLNAAFAVLVGSAFGL